MDNLWIRMCGGGEKLMIRQMRDSDWDEMMVIYKQSLERGNVTFRRDCPTYEEWDRGHIKECRFVYELDGKVIGYTMIAPTSNRDSYRGVVEVSIFVDQAHT
ncbi:MAG: GNAT family N-acetyltransferase, partial [Lachnospiraceae bacterium]